MAEEDKDKGWPRAIRHYQSNSGRRGTKGVVVEQVTPGSDTARFFERMERRRVAKACQQTIDLRGRVAGECKRYIYKAQAHYMDEASYQTFRAGLRENGGVFTVGVFETIVNATHVKKVAATPPPSRNRAAPKAAPNAEMTPTSASAATAAHAPAVTPPVRSTPSQPPRPAASTYRAAVSGPPEAVATPPAPAEDDYVRAINPPIIPFGYYHKRKDPRLVVSTPVEVAADGTLNRGRTRDLSLGGMLVIVTEDPCTLAEGQQINVTFPELRTLENGESCRDIVCRVARIERKNDGLLATLIRTNRHAETQFNNFVEAYIANESANHKIDPEDDLCTASVLAHEGLYSASLTYLPLFFKLDDSGAPALHSIGVTDHNRALLDFFLADDGSLDLAALRIPDRVRHLCMNMASSGLEDGAESHAPRTSNHALLIAYKNQQGPVHTITDFELPSAQDKPRLLRYAMLHAQHRIFKISMTLVRDHDVAKMDVLSAALARKSASEATALREEVRAIFALGMLVDITASIAPLLQGAASMIAPNFQMDGLSAFRGAHRVPLGPAGSGDAVTTLSLLPEPKIIPFGIHVERREERFLAKTKVEMEANGQRIAGLTRDVSTRGACIMLDAAPPVRPGDHVTVGFLSFTKKNYNCDIRNIPYRVVRVVHEDVHYVMLEREKSPEWEQVTAFFNEIIEINRQKLGICVADVQSMAAARLHEEALSAHLLTTPVFLGKDDSGRLGVQRVAVSEHAPHLADYFYTGPHHIDYRMLNGHTLLNHLAGALKKSGMHKGQAEPVRCDLILHKEIDGATGSTTVHCISEFELSSPAERAQLIDQAIADGSYRFMRLAITHRTDNMQREIEDYLEPLRTASRHRAAKLEQELLGIFAVGDLLDITSEVIEAHTIASSRV